MTCAIVIRVCRRGPSASATWQAIWQCNDIHVTVTSRQPEEIEYDLGGSIWGGSRFTVVRGNLYFNSRPCYQLGWPQ
jgi:hypothetical protein